MRFCEKLKDARTKAGMKQEELAKALGVSLRTITNYESGECYPRNEVSGLFAGGNIADEDLDVMMKALQDAYWIAKEKNKKFTPKKYRRD